MSELRELLTALGIAALWFVLAALVALVAGWWATRRR